MTFLKGAIGTLCFVILSTIALGQKDYTKEADLIFQAESYYAALDAYKKAYAKEKKQTEKARILYRIGECYRLMQDAPQAEIWYMKAEAAEYNDPELKLHFGDVLMKQGRYDEALAKYREALNSGNREIKEMAETGIASCEKAVFMAKNPARYMVRNEVQLNTKFMDFSAYFADKKLESIVFTSSRPNSGGNGLDPINGESYTDIYLSQRDNKGKWSAPVPLGITVNSEANEGSPFLDSKYSEMYFTRCGVQKNRAFGCQIYKSRSQGQSWAEPELLDFGIDDTTAAGHPVAIDDETILFSSDIKGGQGGKDLWIIRYEKKTKQWGPPTNLGSDINTPGNEMFPYLHQNGNLYFASDGHEGMGALDIFVAEKKGEMKWGKPQNLGAPINSPANDFAIIYEDDNDRGFFSSDRDGGKGGDDIYSFRMPPLIFKLEGTVTDIETKEPLGNVKVQLVGTDGTVGEVRTDPTGHYVFEARDNEERYIIENTSYTVEVTAMEEPAANGNRYLSAKGQETTVGLKESTAFIKDFALQCASCVSEIPMPQVFYPLGEWTLRVDEEVNSKDSLEFLYNVLVENPTIIIELAAHTDTRGSDKSNQILSQKRAETCVQYLAERGIDPARMVPVGYGESRPKITDEVINSLGSEQEREAAHAKNRRTVFSVLSFDYVPKSNGETAPEEKTN